jgi:hypothetical protein
MPSNVQGAAATPADQTEAERMAHPNVIHICTTNNGGRVDFDGEAD